MGHRAGVDRCGKSRPHRDSIPGPSSPQRIAIPTELSQPPPSSEHRSYKFTTKTAVSCLKCSVVANRRQKLKLTALEAT